MYDYWFGKKKSQKKTLHFINVTTLCHIDRLLVWQKSNQMVERHAPICQTSYFECWDQLWGLLYFCFTSCFSDWSDVMPLIFQSEFGNI